MINKGYFNAVIKKMGSRVRVSGKNLGSAIK